MVVLKNKLLTITVSMLMICAFSIIATSEVSSKPAQVTLLRGDVNQFDHSVIIPQMNETTPVLKVSIYVNADLNASEAVSAAAIRWGADHDRDIVHMELVSKYSDVMDRLITIAAEKYGIIFIASAE